MLRSFQARAVRVQDASFTCNKRLLQTELMETLSVMCVTRTFAQGHFADLRAAHHDVLLKYSFFQRRQRTDHPISCANALKRVQCERVGTTSCKRRLLLVGAVQRTTNERLNYRVMFIKMVGEESPRPSQPKN